MEVNQIINDVLTGKTQSNSQGHLVHPLIKLFFIIFPLAIASYILFFHPSLSDGKLYLILITSIVCRKIDFRESKRRAMSLWTIFYFFSWIIIILDIYSIISLGKILSHLNIQKYLSYLTDIISVQTSLMILLFYSSASAIRSITATDSLWLSRMWLLKRLIYIHTTIVITYFLIRKTLPEVISSAWSISWYKARLSKKLQGFLKSKKTGLYLLLQNLGFNLKRIATLTESVLTERGFFYPEIKNPLPIHLSAEDKVALILCFFLLMYFMIPINQL
jgi:hypothetical protein